LAIRTLSWVRSRGIVKKSGCLQHFNVGTQFFTHPFGQSQNSQDVA